MARSKPLKSKPEQAAKPKENIRPGKSLMSFHAYWMLPLLVFVLYFPALDYDFTELDDSIFIKEQTGFYEEEGSMLNSFKRGVFSEKKDIYYRPLLLQSFILDHRMHGEEIRGWHLTNIVLHALAVMVLFSLLRKLKLADEASFILTMLFAVHPVLSQAVVWVPGRNDSLLGLFVFGSFRLAISWMEQKKFWQLCLVVLLMLAALFTKESALFAIPAGWLLVILYRSEKIFGKPALLLYSGLLVAFIAWFSLRSQATLVHDTLNMATIVSGLSERALVIVQYLGKMIIPADLHVFPMQDDTTIGYGLAAIAILTAVLVPVLRNNQTHWKKVLAGAGIFLLLLTPVLLVPRSLNNQDFEHRLYVPALGILLLLSESILFKNPWPRKYIWIGGLVIAGLFAIVNHRRQELFKDPVTFWTEAVRNSPGSGYALMMLAARTDETDKARADSMMLKAYKLDSSQKYINYYMGMLTMGKGALMQSEPFFRKELQKSGYYVCHLHLARIEFEKKNKPAAISHLEQYIAAVPDDEPANNNLMMMYYETGDSVKLKSHVARMQNLGMKVPAVIAEKLR